jgi:microsomal dipeptidase-like Zn-dependent dipeptidase
MPFFDFHCHPGLKPMFSNPDSRPSPWQRLVVLVKILGMKVGINGLFNEVLNSQASLRQLADGNVNLIGLIIHAPEPAIAKALLEKQIIQSGKIKLLQAARLREAASGKANYDSINNELDFLLDHSESDDEHLQKINFKIINSMNEYDENDINTIHAVIIVEGMHSFLGDPGAPDFKEQFLQNFDEFTSQHRMLAVNLCHFQPTELCNHASGMQFLKEKYFYPISKGISEWGREVIDEIYTRGILIDIKHMSYFSRRQFYQLRDGKYDLPLLCTHAGITGLREQERVKYLFGKPVDKGPVWELEYYKPKGHLTDTYFNCTSINLYDEDIMAILRSNGLIGFSFDQRILGFPNENLLYPHAMTSDSEFVSKQEIVDFISQLNPAAAPLWNDESVVLLPDDFQLQVLRHNLADLQLRYFFNNVFHVLKVAEREGYGIANAAKRICIGTDFDGLINAIDCCKTSDRIPVFHGRATHLMPGLLAEAGFNNFPVPVNEFVNGIFFTNAKRFLAGWLV